MMEMENMKESTILAMTGMVCLTILEAINMCVFGTDGTILTGIASLIAGLAGYQLKATVNQRAKSKQIQKEKTQGVAHA